ncbi:PREDICTED: transcription factor IIIB 90 kDa subunit [Cyphomyrmex costatus]|uniref:B-related factor 1 n=1 Tax=Cyphomyrmex costatus TaxID=456900 RepID=A0A195CBB4_9HYME|nr:PREDICTED: transcription factor IIIB 90 kDa subunit [Cyphomyrmex costatus]KYM97990.1 Transcription factor IIIB 90 kDa subunit [Cyphomyrmex costatus]
MSGKCRNCGSTDIETDPGRGDAICVECGFVLEDSVIISQTTYEESSSGKVTVPGHFVANDSTGSATNFGAPYYVNGKESRGITLQNARKGITHLCLQLGLNQNCIDTSVNFYKMALNYHLTRGRKQAHNQAACVYITCRVERTEHMLIDISDVLHICVHELGRTYLRFTTALRINIPAMDPCLYIMRFAHKLEFGDKTHAVSMTALRVVQRMKRDSIHSGRRPSGLCGAALLIAARLHEFSRSTVDIIKIVKVHESTLRKRLLEFGDTPSSALTLEEFMTVDLEEEQDPPAFKAARKKDRERLQKLENIDVEISELQAEIDRQLEDYRVGKVRKRKDAFSIENEDADRFIRESNLSVIQQYVENNIGDSDEKICDVILNENSSSIITGLGPDIASMMAANDHSNELNEKDNNFENFSEEICTNDIDDEELDSYILSEKESQSKSALWNKVNADYLVQQKEKEEKRLKEKEEGKPEKKRRRTTKKCKMPANTAGEAIEKMLQEKKISSKINYEVLKNLNNQQSNEELFVANTLELDTISFKKPITINSTLKSPEVLLTKKYSITPNVQKTPLNKILDNVHRKEDEFTKKEVNLMETDTPIVDTSEIVYNNDDYLDEEESDVTEMSLGQMLESRATENAFCDDGYEYE